MTDISVAIRTFNGAQRLPQVLTALQRQIRVDSLCWEVIVVDNNSTDSTAKLIRHYQATWQICPLRYVLETRQGASYARQRAISEAKGGWIAFLDDDNVPDENWVSAAYQFAQAHPRAAAFGGQIHPQYESPPPQHFERVASFIPVIEREAPLCFTRGWCALTNRMPPGAGLVVHRQAWQQHVPSELALKGPVGDSLALKGEDVEALLYLKKAGWEIWFTPDMHISHDIPKRRFEREYLLRFFQGVGLSKYTTRMVPYALWQRPVMVGVYWLSDLHKVLSHLIKYRHVLGSDVVAAAELQLFISSLWSPFYTWRQQLLSRWRWVR